MLHAKQKVCISQIYGTCLTSCSTPPTVDGEMQWNCSTAQMNKVGDKIKQRKLETSIKLKDASSPHFYKR